MNFIDESIKLTRYYVNIESNVLHHFEFYLERLFCIYIFCSLRETDGLNLYLEIWISIQYFLRRTQRNGLHPLH